MANRRLSQFFYTPHAMPVLIDCNIAIGATGAVGTIKGPGVSTVTRLAAGQYKIKFQDNYNKFYGLIASCQAPVTGSNVLIDAVTPGVVYQITALGNTTAASWVTAGLPAGITAAVGQSFLAAAVGVGTATVKAIGVSGVSSVEMVGASSLQLGPTGVSNRGAYVIVQTLGATDASTTTNIPVDPASGSVLYLAFYLSNSSIVVQGE